jgi:hypothetical protein
MGLAEIDPRTPLPISQKRLQAVPNPAEKTKMGV